MLRLSERKRIVIILMLALPSAAQAEIVFGEVGYDVPGADEGREWVAIQNTGPGPLDLTGWKFFEGGVNHKLTPIFDSVLPAGGGAVIVASADGYRADHPEYTGPMFKSSFSLSNNGETLSLKNASGTVMTTLTYAPPPPPPKPPVSTKKVISNPSSRAEVHTQSAPEARDTALAAVAAVKPPGAMLPWIGGIVAVIVLGIISAFMMRRMPGTEADNYTVTEEEP